MQLIVKLIRRYKYLEKSLEEELNKIVVFLKGFRPEERVKLAKLTALLISGGQITVPVTVLNSTLQDHLVKDGIASEFLVIVLQTWLVEKDPTTVWTSLRKAQVDSKIMVGSIALLEIQLRCTHELRSIIEFVKTNIVLEHV